MNIIKRDDIEMEPKDGRNAGDPLKGIDGNASVRIVDLIPGSDRTAHRHPHSEEITVVAKGLAMVWIEGEFHEVSEGDVIRIPKGAAHATLPVGEARLYCFFPHPELSNNYEVTDITVRAKK